MYDILSGLTYIKSQNPHQKEMGCLPIISSKQISYKNFGQNKSPPLKKVHTLFSFSSSSSLVIGVGEELIFLYRLYYVY